jgi:hypothetical protein
MAALNAQKQSDVLVKGSGRFKDLFWFFGWARDVESPERGRWG